MVVGLLGQVGTVGEVRESELVVRIMDRTNDD